MNTTTEVRERPILFSGPMVRAILDGRKTQTRRVVKPQPYCPRAEVRMADGIAREYPKYVRAKDEWGKAIPCPYGSPGERLWVRETWRRPHVNRDAPLVEGQSIQHLASSPWHDGFGEPWRPSIHMPRWASRLTLEITDVRVERLQEISAGDCMAEGIRLEWSPSTNLLPPSEGDYYNAFRDLWESINGPESWDVNPWVWAITFKPLEARNA